MSNFATIHAAIEAAFMTGFGTSPAVYGDDQIVQTKGLKEFARLSIRPSATAAVTMGDGTVRTTGFVVVQLFVEPNKPTTKARALALADKVADILSVKTLYGEDWNLQFRGANPNIIGISDDGLYYQVNVSVGYYHDSGR